MKQSQVYQLQRYLYISRPKHQTGGFTVLEILIVAVLIALLMAIAAPSWLSFLNTRRITTAQDQVYIAMRLAQLKASQNQARWQFSLRHQGSYLEWAIHPEAVSPTQHPLWEPLQTAVVLDEANSTLAKAGGVYYVRFKHTGDVHHRLGRITFTSANSQVKRCVVVSTLIGAMRKGEEQPTPDSSGRYCY